MSDFDVSGDAGALARRLTEVLRGIESLEDLEKWLRSQANVVSVATGDHLVKTWPPLKEVSVTFKTDHGSTVTRVIDVVMHLDQTFSLAGIHEP